MKNCGIICEYNPLHSGHLYQISETKRITGCDNIIAIMSGSFTQRGIPAIYDKWARCKTALENGIDMVLELPQIYAVSTAERFAFGGVSTAHFSGIIDILSFGCETDDISLLIKTAAALSEEPEEYKLLLTDLLGRGSSFASARCKAIDSIIPGSGSVLINSNAILAVEYLKAIYKLKSHILPCAVKRIGASEADASMSCAYPSAHAIRESIKKNLSDALPECLKINYYDLNPVFHNDITALVKYKLLTSSADSLKQLPDVSEGIENKIMSEFPGAQSMEELILSIKSKRYTYSRISRIMTSLLLNITEKTVRTYLTAPPYIRILGVKKEKKYLLSELAKKASVPVIISPKMSDDDPCLRIDISASDIHSILDGKPLGRDYSEKLTVI